MNAREDGFSLVEVLIAVVILGVGFTALLGALGVAYSGANTHRQQSDAKTVVIGAAERVKSVVYTNCALPADYRSTARLVGSEYPSDWGSQATVQGLIDVESVAYWNGSTFSSNVADCGDASPTGTFLRLQRIVVTARDPGTRTVERVSIVKRGPA